MATEKITIDMHTLIHLIMAPQTLITLKTIRINY